jgi:hypothetical protein
MLAISTIPYIDAECEGTKTRIQFRSSLCDIELEKLSMVKIYTAEEVKFHSAVPKRAKSASCL